MPIQTYLVPSYSQRGHDQLDASTTKSLTPDSPELHKLGTLWSEEQ